MVRKDVLIELNTNKVVIVVPTHKNVFNVFEIIAIRQLFCVLGKYDITFVIPESLNFSVPIEGAVKYRTERFDDSFFHTERDYNRLCLTPEFYRRFSNYEYMLIYQTDAFVFEDRLEEFIQYGFDYIGACISSEDWPFSEIKVGNGGLSLRKVSSIVNVLKNKANLIKEIKKYATGNVLGDVLSTEDLFFAYCKDKRMINLEFASTKIASQFSVEYDVCDQYAKLKDELPFGCHRWYMENFDVWWPIIGEYGYKVLPDDIFRYAHSGTLKARKSFQVEVINGKYRGFMENEMKQFFPQKCVRIWGNGKIGRQCVETLISLDFVIERIFDEKRAGDISFLPDEMLLKTSDTPILVCSYKWNYEIAKKLEKYGFQQDRDYYIWENLLNNFIEKSRSQIDAKT